MEMPQEAPQGAPQGADVMKEAAANIMAQADTLAQAATALKEAGAPGTDKLMQAAQLMQAALADMGITGGGEQAPSGPVPAQGADANAAGSGGRAVPAQGV